MQFSQHLIIALLSTLAVHLYSVQVIIIIRRPDVASNSGWWKPLRKYKYQFIDEEKRSTIPHVAARTMLALDLSQTRYKASSLSGQHAETPPQIWAWSQRMKKRPDSVHLVYHNMQPALFPTHRNLDALLHPHFPGLSTIHEIALTATSWIIGISNAGWAWSFPSQPDTRSQYSWGAAVPLTTIQPVFAFTSSRMNGPIGADIEDWSSDIIASVCIIVRQYPTFQWIEGFKHTSSWTISWPPPAHVLFKNHQSSLTQRSVTWYRSRESNKYFTPTQASPKMCRWFAYISPEEPVSRLHLLLPLFYF